LRDGAQERENKNATFRKLVNVWSLVRRKRNPAHVIAEGFVTIPGELGLINVENFENDL